MSDATNFKVRVPAYCLSPYFTMPLSHQSVWGTLTATKIRISKNNHFSFITSVRIGVKGAMVLGELIAQNHLIQFVVLSDSNLS